MQRPTPFHPTLSDWIEGRNKNRVATVFYSLPCLLQTKQTKPSDQVIINVVSFVSCFYQIFPF